MATKKAAKKSSAKLSKALVFKIDWVKDPMPQLRRLLDASALRQIEAAKKDFGNRVNEILKSAQG